MASDEVQPVSNPPPLPLPLPPPAPAPPTYGEIPESFGNHSERYTFFCGGTDKQWISEFERKVGVVAQDRLIKQLKIEIIVCRVGRDRRRRDTGQRISESLPSIGKERRWAMLVTNFSDLISADGTTIEKVLVEFGNWKANVRSIGFMNSFKAYHSRSLPTGSYPSASRDV